MSRLSSRLIKLVLAIGVVCVLSGAGCPTSPPINYPTINTDPTADAGADQNVSLGQGVTLSGISSTDADGDPLTYRWQQTAGPAVSLDNPNGATVRFVIPQDNATYTFALTVSDDRGGSDEDSVNVFVGSQQVPGAPRADAGVDHSVYEGVAVTLHGENSADPDGQTLRFSWRQLDGPQVSLANPFTSNPGFTAPAAPSQGTVRLEFELSVIDPDDLSDADTVVITVRGTDYDACPNDPNKTEPGQCGCGVPDTDSDGDGTADCNDDCPADPNKTQPGQCGCGVPDGDSDNDGTLDCNDNCPNDPNKTEPGICGCGVPDTDSDSDGVANCVDNCPVVANADQQDSNGNGIGDACESANHAPVANNQSASTLKNTPRAITLTATDADGNPLTYSIVGQPAHGSLTGSPPNLTYTPQTDYVGSDSFTFKANDGQVDSNVATVTITVNDASGGTIRSGETVAGSIDQAAEQDIWTFSGTAGQRVRIVETVISGGLDADIFLYPPGGGALEAHDWEWEGGSATIDVQLKATGTYSIIVQDYGATEMGEYRLTLMNMSDTLTSPADPDGGPISSGQTVSGQMNAASDMDGFTFSGTASQRVRIVETVISGGLDADIFLYPPGGGALEAHDWEWEGGSATIDVQLKAAGTYTIIVGDYGQSETGQYNLSLQKF